MCTLDDSSITDRNCESVAVVIKKKEAEHLTRTHVYTNTHILMRVIRLNSYTHAHIDESASDLTHTHTHTHTNAHTHARTHIKIHYWKTKPDDCECDRWYVVDNLVFIIK